MDYTIEAINRRLRKSNTKVSVKQKGKALALVATLPPKPGSSKVKPFQQEIYLGIPASKEGLKRIENEAKLLGARIVTKEFNWNLYLKDEKIPELQPAKLVIQRFKSYYLQRNSINEATWKNHWLKIYKRLPQDEPVRIENLFEIIEKTERNTRNRLETCRKLQHLADYLGIKVDLMSLKGNYGPTRVQPRDIPTDAEIEQYWRQIPNPDWKWIFGAIAAFGLRPHEAFFCEWSEDGLCVTKGKTGDRLIFTAVYPEWVELWNLKEIKRPKVDFEAAYNDQTLGAKITRQFRRYGVPVRAYDLRHAWALRASVTMGVPVTTAASMMGHSPQLHYRAYVKHINQKHNMETMQRIMNAPSRLKPPSSYSDQSLDASGNSQDGTDSVAFFDLANGDRAPLSPSETIQP